MSVDGFTTVNLRHFPNNSSLFLTLWEQDRNGVHILTGLTRWGGDTSSYQNDGEARHPVTKAWLLLAKSTKSLTRYTEWY